MSELHVTDKEVWWTCSCGARTHVAKENFATNPRFNAKKCWICWGVFKGFWPDMRRGR